MANIRSAYAEVMAAALTDTGNDPDADVAAQGVTRTGAAGSFKWVKTVQLKQSEDEWQGPADEIGGNDVSSMTPHKGGTCTITYEEGNANAEIAFS